MGGIFGGGIGIVVGGGLIIGGIGRGVGGGIGGGVGSEGGFVIGGEGVEIGGNDVEGGSDMEIEIENEVDYLMDDSEEDRSYFRVFKWNWLS